MKKNRNTLYSCFFLFFITAFALLFQNEKESFTPKINSAYNSSSRGLRNIKEKFVDKSHEYVNRFVRKYIKP